MEDGENTSGFSFYTNGCWSLIDVTGRFTVLLQQLLSRFDWKGGYVKVTIKFYPEREEDD
jgi:hypothetical protein